MFDALLLLFIAKNDLASPRHISLKQLTTIMGYHPAKKLGKSLKLNETAISYAKAVDILPNDLQYIIHEYLDTNQTIAKAYARSYKERNYWVFDDEEKAKSQISKLPCGNPSTFARMTRIPGQLNLFFDSTRGDALSICCSSLVANHTTEMCGKINPDYPYPSYWTTTFLKFDNTTNIIFAYSTIDKSWDAIFSSLFPRKYQIKAWKPQCKLQQLQQEFTTIDWVILNTRPR